MSTNKPFFSDAHFGPIVIRAPEFYKHGYRHSAVDVWAFGILMHYLIFKKFPFFGDSGDFSAFIINVTRDPYVIPDDPPTSPAFKQMLIACFEKRPEKRITAVNLKKMYCFDRIEVEDLEGQLSGQNAGNNFLIRLAEKDQMINNLQLRLLEKERQNQ